MSFHNERFGSMALVATEGLGTARFVALLRHIQETHQLEGCRFARPHNLPRTIKTLESALRAIEFVLTGRISKSYPEDYGPERDLEYYTLWEHFFTPPLIEETLNRVLEILNRLTQNPQIVTDEELTFLIDLFNQYWQYLHSLFEYICVDSSLSPLEPCAEAAGKTHSYH